MPQKTVVLTFDDAISNHATFCGPLLKRLHFNATFFVCEFPPDFATNKKQYMTWEQIKGLQDAGFEIGNHTVSHRNVRCMPKEDFEAELTELEERCRQYGIPKPVTFAYPGWTGGDNPVEDAFPILARKGYRLARSGLSGIHVPGKDHPLYIPTLNIRDLDRAGFSSAIKQAVEEGIPILTFHGVPDYDHPRVTTAPELFTEYMQVLAENNYRVIALRDLL